MNTLNFVPLLPLLLASCASKPITVCPTGKFLVTSSADQVVFTDSTGKVLFSDTYQKREYKPDSGQWTHSGRFYVYPIYSHGGHSPWHHPFVVADMQTLRVYTSTQINKGLPITSFSLSGEDVISFRRLNLSYSDRGLSTSYSLADEVDRIAPTN
jgi:hypothetical protein